MWAEWKPCGLISSLIRDFHLFAVADMTPCSGAACLASLFSKTPYFGVAFNEMHKTWLKEILHRMFVSMVATSAVVADPVLVKNVSTYLNRSAEVAKAMLPNLKPLANAVVGNNPCDDGSDIDE